MPKRIKTRVLYISYLSLLEPIPKSQVLPYIFELSWQAKIYLLSFEKKDLIKKEFEEFSQLKDSLKRMGIVWYRLTYHKYPLVLSSLWDIFLGCIFSFYLVIRHRIAIIHARSNIPIAIGFILKSLIPIKLLYDRRGIMGEDHIEHSGWKKGGYLYRLAIWFEKKCIKRSDCIVVLTQKANTQLRKLLKDYKTIPIATIPCCVNLNLFNYNTNNNLKEKMGLSEKFILIYSGSVGTYNLLSEMFDFLKVALNLIPNAHFLVLTQNKDKVDNLLLERKDIDKDTITVIYVPQEKLPLFLSLADVGLVFRKTSATSIAASPIKFGEYLACGLPVISTPKIGDLEEIIKSRKIGVVLNGYGDTKYRQAINEFLSLLTEKESVRKRCREAAQEIFSLERGVNAYLSIYNQLISS